MYHPVYSIRNNSWFHWKKNSPLVTESYRPSVLAIGLKWKRGILNAYREFCKLLDYFGIPMKVVFLISISFFIVCENQ